MKTLNWMVLAAVMIACAWLVSGNTVAQPGDQPAAKPASVKIGYVDFQRILDESVVGKKAQDDLEKEFGATKEMLKKKAEELQELQNQIEKQKDVLSAIALEEKKNLFAAKYKSYMQQKSLLQDQYNTKFIKLVKPMLDEITTIISDIGKEKGYTMIFKYDLSAKTEESALAELLFFPMSIAYFDPGSDITTEVLKRYDAKHK